MVICGTFQVSALKTIFYSNSSKVNEIWHCDILNRGRYYLLTASKITPKINLPVKNQIITKYQPILVWPNSLKTMITPY